MSYRFPEPEGFTLRYRPEIDGLRAVAVIPVIFYHAGVELFGGGFVGVDVFFVISGYLITSIILTEKQAGSFSLANFYERRARRILPALFTVMAVSSVLAWIYLLPEDMLDFSESLVAVATFSSNVLFWIESGYFATATEYKPLIHTWSLAIEEQYYVLFPLLLIATWRLGIKSIGAILVALTLISVTAAQWGSIHAPDANFYLLPTRGWELLLGALVALFLFRRQDIRGNDLLSLSGAFLVAYSVFMFSSSTPFPGFIALLPAGGVALIILFTSPDTLIYKLLSNKVLVTVGLISYSAYLWHQPLFAFARLASVPDPGALPMTGLAALSITLAFVTWKYVEAPFRDRRNFSRARILVFSVTGSMTFIVAGTYGYLADGRVGRLAGDVEVEARQAELDDLRDNRQRLIREGVCQFNGEGPFDDIDEFIANWSCLPGDGAVASAPKVAVFGDSHSADKVVAMRLNGRAPMQLGGAGCGLLPSPGSSPECRKLLQFFNDTVNSNRIDIVVIADRFEGKELSPEYLGELLSYWGAMPVPVVLFSPMPEFPYWTESYLRSGSARSDVDLSAHDRFFATLKTLDVPANLRILNTAELFCGPELDCKVTRIGEFLLVDYGHMSAAGARYFGERLMSVTGIFGKLQ